MPTKTKEPIAVLLMDSYLFWSVTLDLTNEMDKAETLLNGIGRYNKFDPKKIISILKEAVAKNSPAEGTVPEMLRVTIGREYSPVIYIDCHKSLWDMLWDRFKAAKADEIDEEKTKMPERIKVRAFWD